MYRNYIFFHFQKKILNINGLFVVWKSCFFVHFVWLPYPSMVYVCVCKCMCGKHEEIKCDVLGIRDANDFFLFRIIIIIWLGFDFLVGPNHAPLTRYTRVYLTFALFSVRNIKHFIYACLLGFQHLRSVYPIQSPTQNCIIGSMFRLIILHILTHTHRHLIRIHFTRTIFSPLSFELFFHSNTVLRHWWHQISFQSGDWGSIRASVERLDTSAAQSQTCAMTNRPSILRTNPYRIWQRLTDERETSRSSINFE